MGAGDWRGAGHMNSDPDKHDPADAAKATKDEQPSDPDSSVISVKTFKSPKGNVYRITRTNEVDDYEKPPEAPRK